MRNAQKATIRAACIKANPEKFNTVNEPELSVSLSDVLLATHAGKGTPYKIGLAFEEDVRVLGGVASLWNLRTDDLEQQSDETIAFISSLLTA